MTPPRELPVAANSAVEDGAEFRGEGSVVRDGTEDPLKVCGDVVTDVVVGEVLVVARVVGVEDVVDSDGTLVAVVDGVGAVVEEVVVPDGVLPVVVGVVVGMVGQAPLTAYTSTRPECSCFGAPVASSMCDDACAGLMTTHPLPVGWQTAGFE